MNIGNESLTYKGGPAVVLKPIEEILMTKEAQRIIKRACWDLCKAVENPLVYSGRNGHYIKYKGKNLSREDWEKVLVGEIELDNVGEFKDE